MSSNLDVQVSKIRIFQTALVLIIILFSSLFLAYLTFYLIEQFNIYELISFWDDEIFDKIEELLESLEQHEFQENQVFRLYPHVPHPVS